MSLGKKILSAFVEINNEQQPAEIKQAEQPLRSTQTVSSTVSADSRFKDYFDKLFTEANIPGPDYFEFSKMVEAMQGIADEKSRYSAAFAGLSVQGLNKQKLLSTAEQYVEVLNTDAANFHKTVDVTLQEKVHQKKREAEEKQQRIQQLQQEISALQNQIAVLEKEVQENEEKIETNTGGYKKACENLKGRILHDMEKIKHYIH